MFFREKISFLEKPVTRDEISIAETLELFFRALQRHDYELLLPLFTGDARIHSIAAEGRTVSREEFVEILKGSPYAPESTIRLGNFRIAVASQNEAVASGLHQYSIRGIFSGIRTLELRFKKEHRGWLITEMHYYAL